MDTNSDGWSESMLRMQAGIIRGGGRRATCIYHVKLKYRNDSSVYRKVLCELYEKLSFGKEQLAQYVKYRNGKRNDEALVTMALLPLAFRKGRLPSPFSADDLDTPGGVFWQSGSKRSKISEDLGKADDLVFIITGDKSEAINEKRGQIKGILLRNNLLDEAASMREWGDRYSKISEDGKLLKLDPFGQVDGIASEAVSPEEAEKLSVFFGQDSVPGQQILGSFIYLNRFRANLKIHRKVIGRIASVIRGSFDSSEAAEAYASALLLGRFPDGRRILDYSKKGDRKQIRQFSKAEFDQDAEGLQCPFAAHARVSHLRDEQDQTKGRILRRGMPYATDFENGEYKERGLLFISYQRSLANQLYPLLRNIRAKRDTLIYGTNTNALKQAPSNQICFSITIEGCPYDISLPSAELRLTTSLYEKIGYMPGRNFFESLLAESS